MPKFIVIEVPDRFDDEEQTTYEALDIAVCIHRATSIDPHLVVQALRSFCDDIEVVCKDKESGELNFNDMEWPDLKENYLKANALIKAMKAEESKALA